MEGLKTDKRQRMNPVELTAISNPVALQYEASFALLVMTSDDIQRGVRSPWMKRIFGRCNTRDETSQKS